ncbi:ABC transporter permease [Paraburkholderia phenoliruptrix]|uniref:Octopine transport system permease protein occM n=2 Tax=Paraburkholderia phenoliruptrix TaxID=252970 RepID=K0E1W9_9BURK|nr:ABC transporter permease [Paraburkholderia phenoliruptrix]AFT90478.1 Octopine transport system permease protein occM [Paraburkholderia phenoliruptrix BR3459a]CAB4051889.1 Octopine transport system permease protein OccM [Paraburkholderia phenoliruptrix]
MSFDLAFLWQTFLLLLKGVPLTLALASASIAAGGVIASCLALMRVSRRWWWDLPARGYIFAFRGTPMLVQIYIIYYGLSQFPAIRHSFLWPFFRDAYFCALAGLALNTAAYTAEIMRGALLSVHAGQIEAARACGMGRILLFRRIIIPQAIRQMLPAYSNEVILMVKSTSLASTITLMEITGIAAKLISESYRPVEIFISAGAIYLSLNFIVAQLFALLEWKLWPARRTNRLKSIIPKTTGEIHA